jgi:hypothetical protein
MNDDTLEFDPTQPRLSELQDEFKRCAPNEGFWDRLVNNEQTRFNIWDGQSADGKKHGTDEEPAKPWEGASDQRVYLADEIIGDNVALNVTSLWRTLLNVDGVGLEDDADAAVARQVMTWTIHNIQESDLDREIELSAQYMETYGWCILHPTWSREIALKPIELKLAQFDEMTIDVVKDPSREDEALALVDARWQEWVATSLEGMTDELPELKTKEARRIVRELREDGETKVEIPYVCENEPCIRALRPWVDVFVPEDVGDLKRGRFYVRWYYRPEELQAKIIAEDWDEEWVEAAKKTAGQRSTWEAIAGVSPLDKYQVTESEDKRFVEVVYAYSRRINKQGFPAIYLTVFSPHVTKSEKSQKELVAQHGMLDYWHGKMPAIPLVREWIARSITASRGVPEVAGPMQRVEKVEEDALIDRAAMTTLPPRLVPARILQENRNQEWGPAATCPVIRGEEPKFMQVPQRDGVSESVMVRNRQRADSYFGRVSPEIPPQRAQIRQQFAVGKFLKAWGAAFRQEWALIQQYMSPKEWERITNSPKPQWGPTEIGRGYDLMLATDVRDTDTEFVVKKLEAVSKYILPEDAAGVIDRAALITMKLRAIDPLLAKQLIVNKGEASQKIFERVNMELASMFLGNPPSYVEGDPTAQQQLVFAQQIVQANPKYAAALNEDNRFAQALKSWADNRMQSVTQEQNKMVGRLGVKPMEAQ